MRHTVVLQGETDFAGWRSAARALCLAQVAPEDVHWQVAGGEHDLLAHHANISPELALAAHAPTFTVPRAFLDMCEHAILHRDADRFALLYRVLVRLRDEPRLIEVSVDADIARVQSMIRSVRHAIHKMRAFVRFRAVGGNEHDDAIIPGAADDDRWYVAWFDPPHHIVEAAAPFFARRFANMRWSILTPERSAHWDGEKLWFTEGAPREAAPEGDALEDLWRTYYASIFNPARLNPDLMRQHMPRRYWRDLPEAQIIAPLVAAARERTETMIAAGDASIDIDNEDARRKQRVVLKRAASAARHQASVESESDVGMRDATPHGMDTTTLSLDSAVTLDEVREAAAGCRNCPLWEPATQTVFGEGLPTAPLMFVGEQPGDQEDLAGRPFVGPAGKLLNRALAQAGIDRDAAYVTNAVKHFKYIVRGERRLHQKPKVTEVRACHPWLEHELALLKPRVIVALGATAALSLLGRDTPIERNRGQWMSLGDARLLITVHPSYLLRLPDPDAKAREFDRFVADLKLAAEALAAL
ncbi:MAG TPA: UdgX family uracil-DNA binding protein [Burkholderiaceae bacterium]|nr:UdgX family uracil-DNA binding protein [Burkholderiaceae bacterium]